MTFISYAQNFEDIMLWRALKHVENGFYIDVGANDPTVDSVTCAFYERGWRGINIEPMRQYYARLCVERPADINLPVAAGETGGELTFFDIPDTGLSTIDRAVAEKHISAGKLVIPEAIQVIPLTEVCQEHVRGPIHFLKIDVEGFEATVLRGMDFRKWRPWILVIEATKPQTQISSHDEWEHIVLDAGYHPVYFDGLNHYYVAEEHLELREAFKSPPNFFDDFRLRSGHYYSYPLTELEARIQQAEARAWQAEAVAKHEAAAAQQMLAEKRQALAEAQRAEARAQRANAQLAALLASASWRFTRPLRLVKRIVRRPRESAGKVWLRLAALKVFARDFIGRGVRRLIAPPRLRASLIRHLARFPALDAWVRRLASRLLKTGARPVDGKMSDNLKDIPMSARKVLADIQHATGRNSDE